MMVFVVIGFVTRAQHFGTIDDVIDIEFTFVDSIFESQGEAEAHALSINGEVQIFNVR